MYLFPIEQRAATNCRVASLAELSSRQSPHLLSRNPPKGGRHETLSQSRSRDNYQNMKKEVTSGRQPRVARQAPSK